MNETPKSWLADTVARGQSQALSLTVSVDLFLEIAGVMVQINSLHICERRRYQYGLRIKSSSSGARLDDRGFHNVLHWSIRMVSGRVHRRLSTINESVSA